MWSLSIWVTMRSSNTRSAAGSAQDAFAQMRIGACVAGVDQDPMYLAGRPVLDPQAVPVACGEHLDAQH